MNEVAPQNSNPMGEKVPSSSVFNAQNHESKWAAFSLPTIHIPDISDTITELEEMYKTEILFSQMCEGVHS